MITKDESLKFLNRIYPGDINAAGFYVPNDTGFFVSVRNFVPNLRLFLKVWFVDKNGFPGTKENDFVVPTSDGSEYFFPTSLSECFIQSAHLYSDRATVVHRGQCFAKMFLKFGITQPPETPMLYALAADYIETQRGLSYPASGCKSSLQDQGYTHVVDAGGSTPLITVPSHIRRRVSAFAITTVLAGVATRQPILRIFTSGGVLLYEDVSHDTFVLADSPVELVGASGLTKQYGLTNSETFSGKKVLYFQFPAQPFYMLAGQQLAIEGLGGGDTMNPAHISVEDWIDPGTSADAADQASGNVN